MVRNRWTISPEYALFHKRWYLRKEGSNSPLPPPDPYPRGKKINIPNHELEEV
jgi:hypothetical protein